MESLTHRQISWRDQRFLVRRKGFKELSWFWGVCVLIGSRLTSFGVFFLEKYSARVLLIWCGLGRKEGKQVQILKRRLRRHVELTLLSKAAFSITVEGSDFCDHWYVSSFTSVSVSVSVLLYS